MRPILAGGPLAQSRPISIPSLGDGVMLGAAWIDWPVDTRGWGNATGRKRPLRPLHAMRPDLT
jgi:hypothetical protein